MAARTTSLPPCIGANNPRSGIENGRKAAPTAIIWHLIYRVLQTALHLYNLLPTRTPDATNTVQLAHVAPAAVGIHFAPPTFHVDWLFLLCWFHGRLGLDVVNGGIRALADWMDTPVLATTG